MLEGVWVLFSLYNDNSRIEAYATSQLHALAVAYQYGGEPALDQITSGWSKFQRRHIHYQVIDPKQTNNVMEKTAGEIRRYLTSDHYPPVLLRFILHPKGEHAPGPLDFPPELLAMMVLGGLLFASVLAWYLTIPVRRLQTGFTELAKGNLAVRLTAIAGRRRDEIADLARKFDIMAERLEALVNEREQLLFDISHELRSPLARLQLAVELTRQKPERIQESLARIEDEACRVNEMVGELLTLFRAESADIRNEGYFDLLDLLNAVIDDLRYEATPRKVSIVVQSLAHSTEKTHIPSVMRGSAELVRRALENIARNALHHSPPGSAITITTESNDKTRQFEIHIMDEGSGVSEQTLKTMFSPFVRGNNSLQHTGFGLGLAIAQRSIAAHQGLLSAHNRHDRSGLEVIIRLPFGNYVEN